MNEDEKKYHLIITIVLEGYLEQAMAAAKKAGATGGTVFNAHGTANKEIRSFFGIPVLPEKEMIFIIVDNKIKDAVLLSIYKAAGIETKGAGIVFSLPVENVMGVGEDKKEGK